MHEILSTCTISIDSLGLSVVEDGIGELYLIEGAASFLDPTLPEPFMCAANEGELPDGFFDSPPYIYANMLDEGPNTSETPGISSNALIGLRNILCFEGVVACILLGVWMYFRAH